MPESLGNLIVILVLTAVVFTAARSLWRSRKQGGHCNGDCAHCANAHRHAKAGGDTPPPPPAGNI